MPLLLHSMNARRQPPRRGVGTLLFMVFLVIFIMLLVLVVNYTYLAYSQLRTGEVTDTLARIAVTELLDEQLLDPAGTSNQADDAAASRQVVDIYLDKLNATAAANQQLRYTVGSSDPAVTDIVVTPGRVDDLKQQVTDSGANPTFVANPPPGRLLNSLRIEANRPKTGANPLYLFVRAAFTPQAADIGTTSFATLDSRVLGFRPQNDAPTPIVPIAINQTAWETNLRSTLGGIPTRLDFTGRLQNDGQGNLVLLNFDQDEIVDPSQIAVQVEEGVLPDDIYVQGSDYLGPIAPGVVTQTFPSDDRAAGSDGQSITDALLSIAGTRRIFPLFDLYSTSGGNGTGDSARIVGFVAATVLDAQWSGDNLTLELEPEFVVHFTAVTDRYFDNGTNIVDVPENVYVHKLRLSR